MIGAQLLGRPVEEAKADDDARRRRGLCRHDVIDAVADERRAAAAALLDHRQDRGGGGLALARPQRVAADDRGHAAREAERSEEHTSELQSLMRISYAVFCLKK